SNDSAIDSSVTIDHAPIVLNKPVTWMQNVTLSNQTDGVKVEVPADVSNIKVVTDSGSQVANTAISIQPIDNITSDVPLVPLDNASSVLEQNSTQLLAINHASDGYNITYQTAAPYAIETTKTTAELYQKNVTVTHDSPLNYTDVQSYSNLPEDLVAKGVHFK